MLNFLEYNRIFIIYLPVIIGGSVAMASIGWSPGIGDPTPAGWIITIAYLLSSFLCLWTGFTARKVTKITGRTERQVLWFVFSAMLLLLGINKQLDLQVLLSRAGSTIAKSGGWYDTRRGVQAVFVIILAFLGIFLIGILFRMLKGRWKQFTTAPAGIVLLVFFVLFRAAFMQHIDKFLIHRTIFIPGKLNKILELLGIVLVLAGAFLSLLGARKKYGKGFKFDWE